MQFTRKEIRQLNLTGKRDSTMYPHSLQFYKQPPTDIISLEEFEDLALERLKVLRLIERAGAKFNRNSKDYKEMIMNDLRKMDLLRYVKTAAVDNISDQIYDERRRDHISHFILRLAYCRREDLRRWFINQEVDLFRIRFTSETATHKNLFMQANNLKYNPISEDEKNELIDNLCIGFNRTVFKVKSYAYYKVPFLEVLDLVKNRKVFLERGYAYITAEDLVLTVLTAYRTHLSHALAITSRALPQLEEDSRLISMLNTLHQRYIGVDYSNRKVDFSGDVSIEQIDGLSKTSFPLCMRNLHETLRQKHHLKYNGRLQYGLFLKGIGLTLEDSLRFFREEFSKVMDTDKFDKQYGYGIRYNYGKEGKRKNFTPYSCMKIIMSNGPGPGEYHGCPFKHSDESNLRQRLQSLHISGPGINSVVDLATKGHYQIACTRYFELNHNEATPDQGISHPNHYFEESRKVLLGTKKIEKNSSQFSSASSENVQQSQPQTAADNSISMNVDDTGINMNVEDTESMGDIEELLKGLDGV